MIVATALAVVAGGCGHGATVPRTQAPPPARTCLQLIDGLRRVRVPDTTRDRRRIVRRLARTAHELHTRFGLDAAPAAELYAAVARVRQEGAHAIRDGRPLAGRRLFVRARTLELRAEALARDLVTQCR
jgi:hypothetical protein